MIFLDRNNIIIAVLIAIIIGIVIAGALFFTANNNHISTNVTNSTNSTNSTLNSTNTTLLNSTQESESSSYSSSSESDPEYGSDDYVKKWDQSQQGDGTWAYMHDQPVKTEDGHQYKRMYDEGSGESYWYQMDQNYDDSSYSQTVDTSSDNQNDNVQSD